MPLTDTLEVVFELAAQAEPETMNGWEVAGLLTQRIMALRDKLAGCSNFGSTNAVVLEESSSYASRDTIGLGNTNGLLTKIHIIRTKTHWVLTTFEFHCWP